jgi:hypothetical protein
MTVFKRTTAQPDQFYLFTMPGDMCPVWSETYLADGTHVVAPTPFGEIADARAYLKGQNPSATVDELDLPEDLAEVRGWAHTCPLEQIPAKS